MDMTQDQEKSKQLKHLKHITLAANSLFTLGILAFFMAYFTDELSTKKIDMTLCCALLMSLGYPGLIYVSLSKRINILEEKIDALNSQDESSQDDQA